MEQELKSDNIIHDNPRPADANDQNIYEQDELLTIYHKCFPEPEVDLTDAISVKNREGSACSNVKCISTHETLVSPTKSARSYCSLHKKSQLICKTCKIADEFMKDSQKRYFNRESLYECSFPPTNPVMDIDSDSSDDENDEEKNILTGISEEDGAVVKDVVTALVKKHINDSNLEEQIKWGKKKVEESLLKMEAGYNDLIEETQAASNDLFNSMQSLYQTFAPEVKNLEPLDIPFEEMSPKELHNSEKKKVSKDSI